VLVWAEAARAAAYVSVQASARRFMEWCVNESV
jgi:hypothetical protein